jgi:hypothetical protein
MSGMSGMNPSCDGTKIDVLTEIIENFEQNAQA